MVVEGLAIAAVGLTESVLLIVPFAILYTCAENIRGIVTMSTRQELTPDHLLGRVTAAFWLAFQVPGPLGAALVTRAGERVGAPAALAGVGLVAITIGAVTLLTPARARKPGLAHAKTTRETTDSAAAAAPSIPRAPAVPLADETAPLVPQATDRILEVADDGAPRLLLDECDASTPRKQ